MNLLKAFLFWFFMFSYFSFWLLLGYVDWHHMHAYGPITGALLSGFMGFCIMGLFCTGFETVQSWERGPR